jgi:hypothetical protein
MGKVHLISYRGHAACQWNSNQTLTVTEKISEVTCRRCLNSVAPVRSLHDLRRQAESTLESNSKREP